MKKNDKTKNEENRIDQSEWIEHLRKHICIASVGSSTVIKRCDSST